MLLSQEHRLGVMFGIATARKDRAKQWGLPRNIKVSYSCFRSPTLSSLKPHEGHRFGFAVLGIHLLWHLGQVFCGRVSVMLLNMRHHVVV
jgi:hypothetical protein